METSDQITDYLHNGIATDIYETEVALNLYLYIGEKAKEINQSSSQMFWEYCNIF